MRILLTLLVFAVIIDGCREKTGYKEDELYLDYQITGEEGAEQVSVLVQFRERNSYGPTVELMQGSNIQLDGKALEFNEQTRNGPIYVASKSLNEFKGNHQLIFTDSKGQKYIQDFIFSVFTIAGDSVLKRAIDSAGIVLAVKAIPPIKNIRILMTDTSYAGKEVDKILAINKDQVQIKKKDMTGLKGGPIQLEMIAEYHRIMGGKGQLRGGVNVAYTLRREFIWVASPDGSRKP